MSDVEKCNKTRMELRKKKCKVGIKKLASKILKNKKKIVSKKVKKSGGNRFVIDVNVNLMCKK